MNKVHILSPEIVSKIAAGEVIERPASVVKELIENALDAQTGSIELHLEDAGKKLIRLRDTGTGIAKADMETIFQRHATSKIQDYEDLFDIHSLGFRGEALYSIAAVADVVLKSTVAGRQATADEKGKSDSSGNPSGWEIHIRGGKRISLKPLGHPQGTEIEVKELFFNTPARRKFLKSNLSEVNQILNIFVPYTLLHPQIRFCLTHGDKTLIDLTPADDLTSRTAAALNLDEKNLLDIAQTFEAEGIRARLILGDINISRSRRDLQFIFVNGRPVQNKNISFHLNEAFRLILPPHSFPFFTIYLEVPTVDVDVNIHPTKREVKLRDEQGLCTMLRKLAESALLGKSGAKQVRAEGTPAVTMLLKTEPGEKMPGRFSEAAETPAVGEWKPRPTEEYAFPQSPVTPEAMANLFNGPGMRKKDPGSLAQRLTEATFLGIFINKFLLFESDRTLLIIDQHAAQERITFESLIRQIEKGHVEVQQMLSPIMISLSVGDMLVWEEAQEALEKFGFSSTQIDRETVALHSHPALVKDPEKGFRDLLAGENPARCDHKTLARRACRASVMAGDPLDAKRAQYIRKSLLDCLDPFTCPHGRPTLIEMKESFLDKQFLRT